MLNRKRNLEPLDSIPLIKDTKDSNLNNENSELNNNNNFEINQKKCEICGLNISKKEENDHYICHELQGDLEFKLYNNYDFNLHINGNFDKDDELLIKNSNNPIIYKLDHVEKIPQNNKNCSICLLEYKNDDDIMILPCMHYFHEKCINKWFIKEKICPFCKMIFFEKKNEYDENFNNYDNDSENENDSENDNEESENDDEENENNREEENESNNLDNENNNLEIENNREENENNNEENENNNEENKNKSEKGNESKNEDKKSEN